MELLRGWLEHRGLAVERLLHGGVPVALLTEVATATAPATVSTPASTPPRSAAWCVGRAALRIKSLLERCPHLDGVMIGYPGNSAVLIGARGFWRARLTTHGTGEHSGRRGAETQNAVVKAAALIDALASTALPAEADPFFRFGPRLSVTGVQGGNGYSTIPDACVVRVDVRLTPSFGAADAEAVVRDACAAIDRRHPTREPTRLDAEGSWPAYRLPEDSHLVAALRASASHEFGRVLPMGVAGPSNAGNYLASCGVPATCGLGVTYRNLHGADERIELSSILPVYRTYRRAALELLGRG